MERPSTPPPEPTPIRGGTESDSTGIYISIFGLILGMILLFCLPSCGLFKELTKEKSVSHIDSASQTSLKSNTLDTGRRKTYERYQFMYPFTESAGAATGSTMSKADFMKLMQMMNAQNGQPPQSLVLPGTFYIPGLYERWSDEKAGFSNQFALSNNTDVDKDLRTKEKTSKPDDQVYYFAIAIMVGLILFVVVVVIFLDRKLKALGKSQN